MRTGIVNCPFSQVSEILRKPEQERSVQDTLLVKKNPELVKASEKNARRLQANKERILEVSGV